MAPKKTLPLKSIAVMDLDGKKPGEIAKALELEPKQIYDALHRIKSKPQYDEVVGEIRRHVKGRLVAAGMKAALKMEQIIDLDPREKAPAAMAISKTIDSVMDRIGVAPEPPTTQVNLQLNLLKW